MWTRPEFPAQGNQVPDPGWAQTCREDPAPGLQYCWWVGGVVEAVERPGSPKRRGMVGAPSWEGEREGEWR